MRVAVIGSRGLKISNLGSYMPEDTTEIVSGGARGIDSCARQFALESGIKLTEFLPNYELYGHVAPLKRNDLIASNCDIMLAFWDGKSRGTLYTINKAKQLGVPVKVFISD